MKVTQLQGKQKGCFVEITRNQALAIIQSLSAQLLYSNPNYQRAKHRMEDGGIFSIAIDKIDEKEAYIRKLRDNNVQLRLNPPFGIKEVFVYIHSLKKDTFVGWSEKEKNAYLTACTSIEEKIKDLQIGVD